MAALTLAVAALALASAARSGAPGGCGGVETARTHHHPHGQLAPLAVGDSTMLLALYDLAGRGFDANAHGCRQFPEALRLLDSLKRSGRLPHMVVIALGADGGITHAEIGQALGLLCCRRLLVLVTPRELGGGSGADAVTVRSEERQHRGRSRLLDWVNYSRGHGGWFQPDGLHLTTSGALAFTRLLAQSLPWAYVKRRPPPHRRTHPLGP
ncbi:MAG: hypothetical protein ACRDNK_04710 [Solirubrobacteraceae bacterium]